MLKKCLIAVLVLLVFSVAQAQDTHTYSGQLDDQTPSEDNTVILKAGDALLLSTTTPGDTNTLDTVLSLYNPAGELVARNDNESIDSLNSRIAYIAPQEGSYRINVARVDSSTSGHYELDVEVGSESILDYDVTMSGSKQTTDTEHFRFHYTLSGEDAVSATFLAAITRAFENAWHVEIDKMGWPAPPSDGVMGGNALYDIYVINSIGAGEDALGYTSPEALVVNNPNTPEKERYASTSYIAIDNDFHDLDFSVGQDAVTEMRTTAIHEFNHAIQFGYDGAEPHTWLAEATAVWLESVGAGKDQDATGYITESFQYPEVCFGTESDTIMYGEWPFMQLLTDDFGKDAVQNLWRKIADYEGFDAVEQFLEANGTDIPHEFARYHIKNLARDYKLAPVFPSTVWLEDTITGTGGWTHDKNDDGVQELGASYFDFNPTPGVYDVELRNDDHKLNLWALGVTPTELQAIDLGRGGGVDTRDYQKTYLMVFNPTYDNDVSECNSTNYIIQVMPGKGTTNPVDSVWSRANFQSLK